ncbi:MAG: ferritin-like domain-containing protein [Saprospiraceae bacterium]
MEKKSSNTQNGKKSNGVKAKPDAAQALRDLFLDELKDIYWAEKALTKAIPKMIKNATSEDLVDALTAHLEVTEEQVSRLEQVFETIGEKAQAKKCEAMEGLIKEAEEIMESTEQGVVRDAGIIAAGQKVEHYEIASYGTLCSFAKTLGEDEAASLLEETLNEEKEADEKLSEISNSINVEAASGNDYGEDEESEAPTKSKRN